MDLMALREAAIEATERALYDKLGTVPSDESDEWEVEYRRQFALLKQRHGNVVTMPPPRPAAPAGGERQQWPELTGTPEQARWGASLRDERMREIPSEAVRRFLVQTWPRAKQWVDTRDVPTATLVLRLKPQYDDWRQKLSEVAKAKTAEAQEKAVAVAVHRKKLQDSGITPEGLVELIDASERFDVAPLTAKLAEIDVEGRHLRVFETSDPNLLLVKEKKGPLQLPDYAIERDEAIVADLRLYGQAP